MKPRKTPPSYRFRDDVAWREVGGAYHMLTADNRYHCVEDEVGTLVLRRVEAGATLDGLVREIGSRFEVAEADIRRDIRGFLSELVRKRVLTRVRHQTH